LRLASIGLGLPATAGAWSRPGDVDELAVGAVAPGFAELVACTTRSQLPFGQSASRSEHDRVQYQQPGEVHLGAPAREGAPVKRRPDAVFNSSSQRRALRR
jgi:hypothetical protein